MASRGDTELEKWSEHTRALPQLKVGDHVRIQNQTGPFPCRWDKTGTIVQVQQFHQYWVRMSGSGRATLRNRKFLRKCAAPQPSVARMPIPDVPLHPPKPHPPTDENDSDVVTWDTPSMESSLGTLHPWSRPLHLGSHWKPLQHLVPIHRPFPPRPPPFHLHPFNDGQQGAVYLTFGRTTRTSQLWAK